MNENRRYYKKRRRVEVMTQRILLSVIAFAIVISCTFVFSGFMTSAHDTQGSIPAKPSYISIQIQSGDSLWSIAETYKPADQSTDEYIDELITLNGLNSDDIHADQFLSIACYDTSFM